MKLSIKFFTKKSELSYVYIAGSQVIIFRPEYLDETDHNMLYSIMVAILAVGSILNLSSVNLLPPIKLQCNLTNLSGGRHCLWISKDCHCGTHLGYQYMMIFSNSEPPCYPVDQPTKFKYSSSYDPG